MVADHQGCQHQGQLSQCAGDGSRVNVAWRELPDVRIYWIGVVACLVSQPGFTADSDKVHGIWKIVSQEIEVQATGLKQARLGEKPTGYAVFTPEGRAFFILTAQARKPAKTDQERADLLRTLVAYTGTYRVHGDRWTTKVDVAWNPEWVGSEQTRTFRLDGDRLTVVSPWRVMPNWPDKGMTRSIITFDRSK